MPRIAFVCLGNICRSPTAEGIMRSLVAKAGRDSEFEIGSFGVGGWHAGEPPDRRAQQTARAHGIDISTQQAQQLSVYHADSWDLLLAMDSPVLAELQRIMHGQSTELRLFGTLLPENAPMYGDDVPDPYYNDGFETVFGMIERGCQQLLQDVPCRVPAKITHK